MYFLIVLSLFLLSYIKSQDSEETEEKISCSLNTICSDCEFCKNYSNCNFYNIFCYKNTTGDYIRNEELQSNLSIYYKSDREINNFCNSRNIELNSVKKSFNIFESPSNTINNILTRSFHCEYYVTNKYYLNHNTDQARINIEIKNQESSEIRFFLILIYKMGQNWRFFRFDDIQLRDGGFSRVLDQISEFQILLDFFSTNISEEISEYLVLSISTENPSENLKLIYIVIIVVLSFFILIVIVLIVLYYCLKRKMARDQERRIKEEEEKNNEQKKLIEEFLRTELKSQKYNEKINFNDCDSCTICCENFIAEQSEVSITPCSHVSHHECISKWIKEKIKNPCCPNCNYQFMEYIKNPIKIHVKKAENLNINLINKNNEGNDSNKKVNANTNNDRISNNINNDSPNSEQLRINNSQPKENDDIDVSVHISDDDEENNENNNNNVTR